MAIRLLIVSSSPRPYGYCRRAAVFAKRVAEEVEGCTARHVDVYDYRIEFCAGCVSDNVLACRRRCPLSDELEKVLDMVEESDAIIFVSPIYWYNVPAPMKALIDRMTVFENAIFVEGRSRLEGKVVGFAAIGNDVGAIALIQNLMVTLNSMGAVIPPWALAYHTAEESPLKNPRFVLDMANVVHCTVLMVKCLKGLETPREWYRADEEFKKIVTRIAEEVNKEFEELIEKNSWVQESREFER